MTSCEDEVLSIGKRLQKMIDADKTENAPELLSALAKLPMNIDVLTKTRIGMTINDLRKKTKDEKLSKRAKGLIKEWKGLLDGGNGKIPAKENGSGKEKEKGSLTPATIKRNDSTASNLSLKSEKSAGSSKETKPPVVPSFSGSFPPKHLQSDEMRIKACQMILGALKVTDLPDGTLDPEDLAVKIEQKLYEVHRGSGDKYRVSLRSRVFNLRDKKNTALRENVLTGMVAPDKFAVMSAEEMASPEIRDMREKFTQESIRDHQMSMQTGTPSDMFKCGKCQKKNCTYTQLQTRSSDEPMTTFVFCLECGNRWKFC